MLVSKLDGLWANVFVRTAHAAESRSSSPFALQRGQVVVFYRSLARDEDALIKRVVGLPGDTLEINGGQVLINGAAIDEPRDPWPVHQLRHNLRPIHARARHLLRDGR
ncbi:MAG: S26 family signal peptidase [Kouleothrix sp.]